MSLYENKNQKTVSLLHLKTVLAKVELNIRIKYEHELIILSFLVMINKSYINKDVRTIVWQCE